MLNCARSASGDVGEDGARADVGAVGVDHLQRLLPHRPLQDRRAPLPEGGLVGVELVRVHGALHDRLAEPVRARDEHGPVEPRLGVDGEQHAGGADIRSHHPLDPRRQRHVVVVEAVVHPVRDRPVVVQRREHAADRGEDVLDPADVQERLLLTRERRVRQVLRRGAGAHRPRHRLGLRVARDERRVRATDVGLERRRKRLLLDPLAHVRADPREFRDIRHVQRLDRRADPLVQAVGGEEFAVRVGGRREATGHADPGIRQIRDHLAQRGVLAAHLRDVGHADFVEPEDVGHEVSRSVVRRARFEGGGGAVVSCGAAWTA